VAVGGVSLAFFWLPMAIGRRAPITGMHTPPREKKVRFRIDQSILVIRWAHKKHPARGNKVSLVAIDVNHYEFVFHCMKLLQVGFERSFMIRPTLLAQRFVVIAFAGNVGMQPNINPT
jgi:hypothetical protein